MWRIVLKIDSWLMEHWLPLLLPLLLLWVIIKWQAIHMHDQNRLAQMTGTLEGESSWPISIAKLPKYDPTVLEISVLYNENSMIYGLTIPSLEPGETGILPTTKTSFYRIRDGEEKSNLDYEF